MQPKINTTRGKGKKKKNVYHDFGGSALKILGSPDGIGIIISLRDSSLPTSESLKHNRAMQQKHS
jgi:hypothetical protein